MLRVGIAGIGFMGWIHYLAYKNVAGIELGAVSSRDPKKLSGDWRGIQGNFGPPGEQVDLSAVSKYSDFEQMLADPSIDLVDICLPPDKHCEATLQALSAGKHVFVEKPMALTADECQRMVAAAEKAGKQLLVGHVLPFFAEYVYAREAVASGKYGRLIGGSFKRVISDPLWLKDFYDPNKVGGPLVDLHVHDAHFIRMLFGQPTSVVSQGRMRGDVVEYCNTFFQFADPSLVVSASGGVVNQQGRPFTHGFELHLEKATLNYELAWVAGESSPRMLPLTVFDSEGKAIVPELPASGPIQPFEAEIAEVVRSIESGRPSDILGGALACDAVVLCHRQTDSVRQGKAVRVS